jgi:PAS domain S-box-containing protein
MSGLFALLALMAGLIFTIGFWNRSRAAHQREVEAYFNYRSRDALNRIEVRLRFYEQTLLGARGLFQAHEPVSRGEFAAFVASFDLDAHYPGIQGIGFSQLIPAAGKDRHLAQIRRQGFQAYQIRPDGNREIYSSIIYIEPFSGRNLRAFGYDMFSEPASHEAMCRARDTGQVAMSGKVRLVQETEAGPQPGFAVYVPVLAMGSAAQTLNDRQRNLVGWVYAAFRMEDLMHGVLGEGSEDLDFKIYDGPEEKAESLMFDRVPVHTKESHLLLQSSHTLSFGGRSWTVVTQAMPGLLARYGKDPSGTVLILGGLSSLLMGLFTFFLAEQFNRIRQINESLERRVEERTRELKDSETRFRTVANYGYDWEVWEGPGGDWLFSSPSCERITGHAPAAFISDPGLLGRLIHPDDQLGWKAHRATVHEGCGSPDSAAEPSSELDFRIIHPNGEIRWIGHICHPIQDPEKQFLGRRISNRDITERKKAEAQLLVLTQVLEQKNVEMEDMLYAASHDLRSPLLNVRGFSDSVSRTCERLRDRLRKEDVPDGLRRDLEPLLADQIPSAIHFIQSGGQKLDSLIDGLLVVSRAGRQELHLETVDMVGLLTQVQSALAFQLQETRGSVEIGDLPPCLGDAPILNQVFSNLLDNAVKYRHPDRPPRIRVSGRVVDGRSIYCVEDNGIGIDPRHHTRIWKLFHRVAPCGPVKGEGLGLTLVHRLLNRLHGRAWVEAKPDPAETGSCFYVDLPFPLMGA